ncbi:MAG: alkaline phosphatase family protein [Gemmatimonadetes bacterium]|nr:alkaline phosphatase family protein [Gemmatimonadota bacterium]
MQPESRVVFVLIDGARPDVLQFLLDRGLLPNLARWVIEPGGLTVGTTVFPSTTGVAYIPFLFGCYPGTANIPGIRWLDRAEAAGGARAQWRAARSYCGVQGGWINTDIACGPSMFDLVPDSIAICTPVTRGLGPGANLVTTERAILGSVAHYVGTYPSLDRAVADAWLSTLNRAWRFLFVVFPGPDGMTHLKDPWHPAVLETYLEIDAALGRFVARARRQGGAMPAFFVAADHGASVMQEHCDVAVLLEEWGVPTLRHPMHVWRRGARAATMVSGNASVQLYFDPRAGRATPRTEREIPEDLVARLLALPAVRLAACRDNRDGVIVLSGDARARVSETGGLVRYEPLRGDPLGLGGRLQLEDRDMLAQSRGTDVPDAPRQLLQLFRSPRAGDLVLTAGPGADFRGPWEIPEHKSGHGSLIRDHMEVPIAASVPLPEVPIRTVDLMPAMLEHLGVPVPAGLDGVPFSRLAGVPSSLA